MRKLACFTIAAVLRFLASASEPEIHRWVDEAGTIHFSETKPPPPEAARIIEKPVARVVYQDEGGLMKVSVLIAGAIDAECYIDTGASYTLLPLSVIKSLSIDPTSIDDYLKVKTASSVVVLPLVRLSSIRLDSAEVVDIRVAVSASLSMCLLGTDFLHQFRYEVDPAEKTILLSSPRSP